MGAKGTLPAEKSLVESESYTINLSNKETEDLPDPHHDALVISLNIANYLIKRILVDIGSSTNILQLSALKEIKMYEVHIVGRSITLAGFNVGRNQHNG